MAKVRCCEKCREYISINESPFGHRKLSLFEKSHKNHPLITIDSDEAGDYVNLNQKYDQFAEKRLYFNKIFLIYAIVYLGLNFFFIIFDPYDIQRYANNGSITFIFIKMNANKYQFYIDGLVLPIIFGILLYSEAKKRKRDYELNFAQFFKRFIFLFLFGVLFLVGAATIYAYSYLILVDLHVLRPPI